MTNASIEETAAEMPGKWFQRYRLAWIDDMIHVYGFVNREHLMRKFGISTAQAAIDLRRFQRRYPNRVSYNLSAKRYEAK